jgi:hypothetical protein
MWIKLNIRCLRREPSLQFLVYPYTPVYIFHFLHRTPTLIPIIRDPLDAFSSSLPNPNPATSIHPSL